MHGRGARADDLQSLADELSRAAPKAKFRLAAGPHPIGKGLTWYPRFTASTPEELEQRMLALRVQARGVVMSIVNELRGQGVPDQQIYVGGFSQGASVALDVAMSPEGSKLGGLISLSGGAIDLDLSPLQGRAKLRAFVSHGSQDRVIQQQKSRDLVDALRRGQHEVRFVEFDGDHTIPGTVRHDLGEFLAAE
jgi:predicted esterase